MSHDTNSPKNRHERRKDASFARRKPQLDRESKAHDKAIIDTETRRAAIEKRTEVARKKGEARRAFRRKVALEHGVNPRRVVILGTKNGTASYKIRMA